MIGEISTEKSYIRLGNTGFAAKPMICTGLAVGVTGCLSMPAHDITEMTVDLTDVHVITVGDEEYTLLHPAEDWLAEQTHPMAAAALEYIRELRELAGLNK